MAIETEGKIQLRNSSRTVSQMESLTVSIVHLGYVLCFAMILYTFLAKQDPKFSISLDIRNNPLVKKPVMKTVHFELHLGFKWLQSTRRTD